jgi:F-type H+-transporting ATPase subunit b
MEALGINIFSLVVYSILFFIVYLLLEKFLLPKLRENIEARRNLIEDTVEGNKKLEKDKAEFHEVLKAEQKKKLIETSKQAEEMLQSAEGEASEVVNKAKHKASNVLSDARQAGLTRQQKLEAKFDKEVKATAVEILKELKGKNIDELNPVELRDLINKVKVDMD